MSYQPRGEVLDWLLAQPEVTRGFAQWTERYRGHAARDLCTLRLGAIALAAGFDSGQALYEADSRALSPTTAADRAHVLLEYHASALAEGRLLGRALLALAAQLLPRAGVAPGAAVPVARCLLDAFFARLDLP